MAKEGDETSTNKRSEAPKLLDAEVPSSKRVTTSADFSSISPQVEKAAPQAVGAADNITETPLQADEVTPDPYEMSPSDLEDDEEPEEGAIQFSYKTMSMGDTKGLEKAMRAKAEEIKALGLDYQYVFRKIVESQTRLQGHPKSLAYVYWYKDSVASMFVGIRMKDHFKLEG